MTTNPSILKRTYDAVALFALLNIVALGGLGIYLAAGKVVDREKLRRAVAVLRGKDATPGRLTVSQPPDAAADDVSVPVRGADGVAGSQMELEILRRESERVKTELEQRLALNNSILLRVMTERESFRRERQEALLQREAAEQQRREEGFRKQIAIYESLAPKIAVQHLLDMPEPDEAAKILLEINTRKARAIVEAARRGDQMSKMKVILQRVREVAPERSAELDSQDE
jgi:hypothetical protein